MEMEATTLEDLPYDVMVVIAELCTQGVEPVKDGTPSSYARYHAALARTSKHFYHMLNRALYIRNLRKDPGVDSCVLWAARKGRLGTIERAHDFGADLNGTGARDPEDYEKSWQLVPGKINSFASPLHLSILHNHPVIFNYLLHHNADVHSQSRDFCGCALSPFYGKAHPLHVALSHPHEDATYDYAGMLVRYGAYKVADDIPALPDLATAGRLDLVALVLNRNDQFSLTSALHFAVSQKDLDLVDQILARDGVNAAAMNWQRYNPLHVAISEAADDDSIPIINRLLQRPEVDASDAAPGDEEPLHIAAWRGRGDIAALLLKRPDVRPTARTAAGVNALHIAARFGRKEVVEVLLACPGFPVGEVDLDGMTALHHLCRAEETEDTRATLELLIHHPDIDIDLMSNYGTPLFMAVKNRRLATATALVRAGSDIHPPNPFPPVPPAPHSLLHECLLEYSDNQVELARELIARGADVDLMVPLHGKNATPLFFAAAYASNVDAVQVLLEAGANIYCLVRDLWVPFESCMTLVTAILETFFDRCHPGHHRREAIGPLTNCLQLLLEYGAVLGLPDFPTEDNFHSALHCAVQMTAAGYQHVLDVLLEHSEARNISEDYLDDFISGQVDMTRQGLIPRLSLEKLMDFRTRIFPRRRSQSFGGSSYADYLVIGSLYHTI